MGRFIAKEWDIKRPLWEMLLVRNYHDEDGACCALLSRAYVIHRIFSNIPHFHFRHHTLADGQGYFSSVLAISSKTKKIICRIFLKPVLYDILFRRITEVNQQGRRKTRSGEKGSSPTFSNSFIFQISGSFYPYIPHCSFYTNIYDGIFLDIHYCIGRYLLFLEFLWRDPADHILCIDVLARGDFDGSISRSTGP